MGHARFVTAITCMDGRVQEPVSRWLKKEFDADFVDTITEPGPDRLLAEGPDDAIASIRKRAAISVSAHGSRLIAVVAHHDCAGNPVSRDVHLEHLERAINVVASWGFPVRMVGLWVDERWEVEFIYDTQAD